MIGNLVLQNATERLFCHGLYADVPRGMLVVRGENIRLVGEIVSNL
jgi:small nuclear ribonucleoprotein (snRNP)-like protein